MPFDVAFLNKIRAYELEQYLRHFPAGARILEIGGGTGMQAKLLTKRGFKVTTIDIPNSTYSDDLVFDVTPYDGKKIPLPDDSVDIVFSSNVLEHIPHIDDFHNEMNRVMRPGGIGVHAMPTGVWTFWTIVTHYLNSLQLVFSRVRARKLEQAEKEPSDSLKISKLALAGPFLAECWRTFRHTRKYAPENTFPQRHGEFGTVFSELWTFSRWWWIRHLKQNNYRIIQIAPMRLFYTGYMFLGPNWSIKSRHFWSYFLGSACIIYVVQPANS